MKGWFMFMIVLGLLFILAILIQNNMVKKRFKTYFQINTETEISFEITSFFINHGDVVFNSHYHLNGIIHNNLDDISRLWKLPENTMFMKKANNDTIRILPPKDIPVILVLTPYH